MCSVDDDTLHLTYQGPPALVGALAQMLREEGLQVDYRPPMERKDLSIAQTVVDLAVQGAPVLVAAVVGRFSARFGGTKVDGLPEPGVSERLKKLGELQEQGVITPEEYAEQRKRILDQL